jgi:hypothetical protein
VRKVKTLKVGGSSHGQRAKLMQERLVRAVRGKSWSMLVPASDRWRR